jgi:hypothetical protein
MLHRELWFMGASFARSGTEFPVAFNNLLTTSNPWSNRPRNAAYPPEEGDSDDISGEPPQEVTATHRY